MPPHLVVAVSYHGFGHIAQTAPVVNELVRRIPGLRVTVQSAAPPAVLRRHFRCAFDHVPHAADLGVVNRGPLTVLVDETASAYRDFHANWPQRLADQTARLRALRADAMLADVPYLPLAAAAELRMPAAALCSLNWMDIYAHYCGERPEAAQIMVQMRDGYARAAVFLQPAPSMPMADLANTRRIGPIARLGRNRGAELRHALHLGSAERLVVIALGGIQTAVSLARWPRIDGVRWLVQADWQVEHPDAVVWDQSGFDFADVLCSADALITKPGYGSFAEAACNGVRTLYIPRGDWPEETFLVEWLPQQVPCLPITREQFAGGRFAQELATLFASAARGGREPTGIAEAADAIQALLDR